MNEGTQYKNLGRITSFTGETPRDRVTAIFVQVAKSIRDPLARTILAQAVQGVPERDDWAEVSAVYWFVRNHLRYTGDVRGIDTYSTLPRMWNQGIADCDDFSVAYDAILISGGYRSGVMILAQDGTTYSHVLAVVELPRNEPTAATRRIVALDGTVPNAYPGWLPPGHQNMNPRIYWYSEVGADEV